MSQIKLDLLNKLLKSPKEPLSSRILRTSATFASITRKIIDLFDDKYDPMASICGNIAQVAFFNIAENKIQDFCLSVKQHAEELDYISSVDFNLCTQRIIFKSTSDFGEIDRLIEIVRETEKIFSASSSETAYKSERELPDNSTIVLQTALEAAADAASVGCGLLLKLLPSGGVISKPIGEHLYSALFVASHIPSVYQAIENKLGKRRSEFFFHLAYAAALGLSERPLTSAVSFVDKLESLREIRARRVLWQGLMSDILRNDVACSFVEIPQPRPVPLPKGPIEKTQDRALKTAAFAFVFSLLTTKNPFRAVPAAFAAMPYPAQYGRELFAKEIGLIFSRRGMLVLCPEALRCLDRIDCLVIPGDIISRDQFHIEKAVVTVEISEHDALAKAKNLFRPDHPLRVQKEGEWSLGPLSQIIDTVSHDIKAQLIEHENKGILLLALSENQVFKAAIEVSIETRSSSFEAAKKAAKMGIKLYAATDDPDFSVSRFGIKIEGTISLQNNLAEEIREMQRKGGVVCLVGSASPAGFLAADFGVYIRNSDAPFCTAAHVMTPQIPRILDTILDACSAARLVSKQSATVSMVSATMGALASTGGKVGAASGRVVAVMSAASLISMFNGVVRSHGVGKHYLRINDPTPWHALSTEGVKALLSEKNRQTSTSLIPATKNLEQGAIKHLSRAVTQEMSNPLTPLLALGAGLSAIVGSKADAGIITGVGIINGIIGGTQRFRTERHISRLIQTAETKAHVVRGEEIETCSAASLSVGDIIFVTKGDVVPADCRILKSENLEVDTSTLTGESLPVSKSAAPSFAENVADITSMLFEGNHIVGGWAHAAVTATGENTVTARASLFSVTDEVRGGVEARLKELMNLTGPITLAAGAALIATGMLRGRPAEELVSTAVGLAVAAVPEGLPLLATVAQLAAAERLSMRGALVKNPRAVEALGRADILCMDKTGTLTEGRIAPASVFDGTKTTSFEELDATGKNVLFTAIKAVTAASDSVPDPIDAALLRAGEYFADELTQTNNHEVISTIPFDSARGYEAVILKQKNSIQMLVKGMPEKIISIASFVKEPKKVKLTIEKKKLYEDTLEKLTSQGLRVVALAEKISKSDNTKSISSEKETNTLDDLTILGLLAFRDPVRKGAADTIGKLSRAGVRTVMITGDHPKTALSAAREAGLTDNDLVLSGDRIALMTDEELEAAVDKISVFARVAPAQKVRIIKAYARKKHIVGMVGDGANDAAAMRAADAGIAVGLDCTESARASADIVLKETHIDELFDAVVEGRAMWRSVRNAVSVLVGGNLGEIAFTVAAGALSGRPPLSPRQLLVVNFLTDIAPSTAIAIRPPSVFDLHALREVGPEAALGSVLNREIAARAICTSLGAWSAWSFARLTGSRKRASTVGLLGLVGSQLGQTIMSGGKNRAVVITGLGSAAALGAMVQIPGLSHILGCTPIGPLGWSTALTASITSTLLSPVAESVIKFSADKLRNTRSGDFIEAVSKKTIFELKDVIDI